MNTGTANRLSLILDEEKMKILKNVTLAHDLISGCAATVEFCLNMPFKK